MQQLRTISLLLHPFKNIVVGHRCCERSCVQRRQFIPIARLDFAYTTTTTVAGSLSSTSHFTIEKEKIIVNRIRRVEYPIHSIEQIFTFETPIADR